MAHDVFISYASEDKAVADAVCATIESQGVRCWIAPRDVLPGKSYPEAIEEAIAVTRLMVMVFSEHSAASPAVLREVHLAFSREKTIVPFRIHDLPLSGGLNYLLGVVHWLDAMTPPLEEHLRTLAARVREHLGPAMPPPMPDRSSHPEAKAHHDRGAELYRQEKFDMAIVELTRALQIDPSIAWAWNDRGSAYLLKGELDLAIADLNTGVRMDPANAWPFHTRGTVFFRKGDWDSAIADYSAALRLDPTLAWACHDRGAAQLHQGRFAKAVADFTQAILLNPEMEWAYRNRATAYERIGNVDLARADITAADKIRPKPSEPKSGTNPERIVAMLLGENRSTIRSAWSRLTGAERPRHRDLLVAKLASNDAAERRAAATALWTIQDRDAVPLLTSLLLDEASTVLLRVLALAAESRSPVFLPGIAPLLCHKDPAVRQAARHAGQQAKGRRR